MNGYICLAEKELNEVRPEDHLTVVGHSVPPKISSEEEEDSSSFKLPQEDEIELGAELATENAQQEDTGLYLQRETVEQLVKRLQQAGLKKAPQILSLECCMAAVANGIEEQLSSHRFFINTIIETNTGAIGRNPGNLVWSMPEDGFGRVVMKGHQNPWIFLLGGTQVAKRYHGNYQINEVIRTIHTARFSRPFLYSLQTWFKRRTYRAIL